jgi:plasmid stabilization system protein ParE
VKVEFHPQARLEFLAATDWYALRSVALGDGFVTEIKAAIDRVSVMPAAWPIVDGAIRRVLVSRFPYGVLYEQRDDCVYVVAVMHTRQRPDYWRKRIA